LINAERAILEALAVACRDELSAIIYKLFVQSATDYKTIIKP
jgi:hypothetical protein